ncbi:MAG: hypothetical protein IK052_02415 [Bacteroidales bacterium]|nr:hypothetical protein [Bacteroidales bacterium]
MKNNFWIAYVLLFIAQLLLCNYFVFTPWMMATLLPAMVLCLPLNIGTTGAMLIACLTGLGVDFLAEGIIGLNALALVPVAFARRKIISMVFGPDLITRNKLFSIRRNGLPAVLTALLLCLSIFIAIYVWADSAGTRSFGFNTGRFFASLAVSLIFSVLSVRVLTSSESR